MSERYKQELIEEIEERCYALRAIEAPNWRWLAGMLVTVRKADGEMREMVRLVDDGPVPTIESDTALPVLEDPATFGCLLSLVVRASKDKNACLFTDVIEPPPNTAVPADMMGVIWRFSWMPAGVSAACPCGLCGRYSIAAPNKIACLVAALEMVC